MTTPFPLLGFVIMMSWGRQTMTEWGRIVACYTNIEQLMKTF